GQQREAGEDAHPEEDAGERRRVEPPPQIEPVRDDRWDDESTGEGVEPKECGELRDGAGRAVDADEPPLPLDLSDLDSGAERAEDGQVQESDERIEDEERPVRVGATQTLRGEEPDRSRGERTERAR